MSCKYKTSLPFNLSSDTAPTLYARWTACKLSPHAFTSAVSVSLLLPSAVPVLIVLDLSGWNTADNRLVVSGDDGICGCGCG
jgi:hypothetical protein